MCISVLHFFWARVSPLQGGLPNIWRSFKEGEKIICISWERRGEKKSGKREEGKAERMAVDSIGSWNWGITWVTEKAFAFKNIQNTASFSSSVPFPLLAQGEPRCCHGSLVVLPFLLEPRLTGLGTAAVEGSSEGQGCRARGGCLRRCLSKQKMQVLGKWREGPGGSALMRLWGVQRTS